MFLMIGYFFLFINKPEMVLILKDIEFLLVILSLLSSLPNHLLSVIYQNCPRISVLDTSYGCILVICLFVCWTCPWSVFPYRSTCYSYTFPRVLVIRSPFRLILVLKYSMVTYSGITEFNFLFVFLWTMVKNHFCTLLILRVCNKYSRMLNHRKALCKLLLVISIYVRIKYRINSGKFR